MENPTQIERYKKLRTYIDENYKKGIDIKKIEEISHYSYRNINRIFLALHNETIGKYIKRIRLEKSAQYLKFSEAKIADIAFEFGFESAPVYNKAFKNRFGCSPRTYRNNVEKQLEGVTKHFSEKETSVLDFTIEFIPDFEMLCLEYRGKYDDNLALKKHWNNLFDYSMKENLLTNNSTFLAEILDDNNVSDSIQFRYNCALKLNKPFDFEPKGFFKIKQHKRQKYVKIIHQGSFETSEEAYIKLYMRWMIDVQLEFKDLPTIEIYSNFDNTSKKQEYTEIYIPVF